MWRPLKIVILSAADTATAPTYPGAGRSANSDHRPHRTAAGARSVLIGTAKLVNGIVSPAPHPFTYASFIVQQLKNA